MNDSKELKKQIISALCEKLGVEPYELFRFTNQKTEDVYFFDNGKDCKLKKCVAIKDKMGHCMVADSTVSLTWLMSDQCEIELADKYMAAEFEGVVNWFKQNLDLKP